MSEHSVPSLVPLVTFVAVYYVYLVGAQLSTTIAPIGNRYLAPVYVPLVVIGAAAASRLVVPVRERLSRRTSLIARLLLALVVVGQAVVFVAEVQTSASNGVGFAAQSWQRSQLADVVRDVSPDARLYSNVPDGLWAVLQREPLYLSPLKRVGFSNDAVAISPDFPKDIECDVSYLAWFTRNPRPYLYSRSELKQVAQLVVVSKVADGTLYRLEPRSITPAGEACRGPSGNRSA